MKTQDTLAVLLAFNAAEGSVTTDAKTGIATGNLKLTAEDGGELSVTTDQFDTIYRNMVRVWPVIKPLKEQVIELNRAGTIAAKVKAKEDAAILKAEAKEKAKQERLNKLAAEKQAKADAKAAAAKAKEDAKVAAAEEKKKADAAKAKLAADAKAKADAAKVQPTTKAPAQAPAPVTKSPAPAAGKGKGAKK